MKEVPSIKDVAAAAGVSISTVSRVLNHTGNVADNLKMRVHEAVDDIGYSINPIASNLKSAKRNQIAVVVPSIKRTYYTDFIKGISDFFYDKNIFPVILESDEDFEKEKAIIGNLQRQWIDGIILIPGQWRDDEEYAEYAASLGKLQKCGTSIPVVLAESYDINPDLDLIRVDYEVAFYAMAQHLLEIGRKRIVYLGNATDAHLYRFATAGVKRAMEEYGLILEEKYIKNNNYTVLDGYHSMVKLIRKGYRIDGIICANDQVAAGVLGACRENGISVPQELAIVGLGGVALSIVTSPSLTTVITPKEQMGETAAKILYERMSGIENEVKNISLRVHMAIRESTMKSAVKNMDVMFAE